MKNRLLKRRFFCLFDIKFPPMLYLASSPLGLKVKSILINLVLLSMLIILSTACEQPKTVKRVSLDKPFKALSIKKVDSLKLRNAIHDGAYSLIHLLNDNGQFVYKVNLDTSIKLKPKYNTLRHAGSIYALCMYYEFSKDAEAMDAALSAAAFLKDSLVAPLRKKPKLLGVWSRGDINNDKDPDLVKLGGNGLGLISLAYLERLNPGSTHMDTLRRMGDFILYMQKKNGGFYSKYIPKEGGRDDSWTSLYYPGEAALGLLLLYEIDKDKKWLNAAADALMYLKNLREGKSIVEADHWALLASHKLLMHFDDLQRNYFKDEIIEHEIQIVKSIIRGIPQFPSHSPYYGCMTGDGRTTPTSTRLEGLLSFIYDIPEERESLFYSCILVSNKGIDYLERAQVKLGPYKGGMTRALSAAAAEPGVINVVQSDKRDSEVRIDYTQHALSAWIQYYNLVYTP